MKRILIISILFSFKICEAQYVWQSVGGGLGTNVNHSCRALLNDTISNLLIASGTFTSMNNGTIPCGGTVSWDETTWTTIASPGGTPTGSALVLFNGNIYSAGENGGIGYYNGTNPVNIGIANNSVYCLCVYHNKLYVGGDFTNVDGIPAKRIACYDGTSWSGVGGGLTWTQASPADVRAMCVWNDKLYVGGTFDKAGTLDSVNSVAVWNDTTWNKLGSGVLNYSTGLSTAYVFALEHYNNELYVGGRIDDAGGVAVNYLCRWNDSLWQNVGGGTNGDVLCMVKKDSSLYVGGLFSIAGGVTNSPSIARWDGSAWYSVGLGLDINVGGYFKTFAVYNGELYGGGDFVGDYNGYHLVNIAKYGLINSVDEVKETEFTIYPNPANETLTLTAENIKEIVVSNLLGEVVQSLKFKVQSNTATIDISKLPQGIYLLRVQTNNGWRVGKLVKE